MVLFDEGVVVQQPVNSDTLAWSTTSLIPLVSVKLPYLATVFSLHRPDHQPLVQAK